ncbi:MAG: MerR family transcriptional regulator [Coriobacteriia bacterium]|nr:MerR family transcriptional regulator [Coriobacteriia bacterium]
MKDSLTIKEFSKLSGIETTTLRYWDDIGIFSPAKRDPGNNYRRYAPEQLIAANFITVMSSLNVPLKTIARVEDERDPEMIMEMIEQQEKALDREMNRLRECYSIIHTRRELINYGLKVDESKITVMHMEEKEIILGPPSEFEEGKSFYEPFLQFCREAKSLRVNPSLPIGGYHGSMEDFLRAPDQPSRFFSLDPTGNVKCPAGEYLVGYTRGYYAVFGDLPERMAAYARENSLTFHGPVYSTYLLDEICYKDSDQYLAQISVAVKREKTG